jgi:hypothetical protein
MPGGSASCRVDPGTFERSDGAEPFCGDAGGTAPPSVLPDISPHLGGDRQLQRPAHPARFVIGESLGDGLSPPKWGRCPEGQRGARRIATESLLCD